MSQYAGYFKNGDQWDEQEITEDGKRYFIAIDKNGELYETLEMPTRYPLFTMKRFDGHWTEDEVNKSLALELWTKAQK